MRVLRTLAVVGLIAIAGWTPTCAAERVDLLLVLAADISRSVDEVKFQLQRSGYSMAFSDSRVMEAVRSGPNGRIAVTFVEWSGPLSQKIVIDWMVISDDKTARLFGDHIVEASRAFADSTSIRAGIDFAMTQLDRAPYETRRRVIHTMSRPLVSCPISATPSLTSWSRLTSVFLVSARPTQANGSE